ncbi:immunoglobulin-binding protein 1-like [Musca autumnalis]|uniref:immunoglobulin-binding protein 1-like n=1 Tax=Musca autumnalis TaxID=221902 RepID=UPI003CEC9C0E
MGDENNTSADENRKLEDIFLEGWNQYEFLDETSIDSNSSEYQGKVKDGIKNFELATKIVSQINMFSPNEFIDEIPTESLQYLLLPFFLGKLTLKCHKEERLDVLRRAEVYFKDFLQRCQDYELCDGPKKNNDDGKNSEQSGCIDTTQQLIASAMSRNNKIAQFRRKKELEEQIKKMRVAVRSETVDDEVKRNFFLNFLQKSIIETNEELEDIKLEKGVVEMRKQRMAEFGTTRMDDILPPGGVIGPGVPAMAGGHSHSHGHAHHHHHHGAAPKPKPMQPFIITKDATQKAVFGMGYPSLPVMSVDEFYSQRVQEGIFPDEEKMARINAEKALAAAQDPEEKEEEEKADMEEKIENDDPENLARMRRMDEYRDVVRRGDGNRHNRS